MRLVNFVAFDVMIRPAGNQQLPAILVREAVRLDPGNPVYWANLGDVWRRLGKRPEARASYERAVSLAEESLRVDPRAPDMLVALAVVEAKLGRFEAATRHALEASQLAPEHSEVLYKRAIVHALAGEEREALESLSAAISQGYSAELAREEEDLKIIRDTPEFEKLTAAKAG